MMHQTLTRVQLSVHILVLIKAPLHSGIAHFIRSNSTNFLAILLRH